jgi:Phage integrase family
VPCASTGCARTPLRSSTGSRYAAPVTSQSSPPRLEALARACEDKQDAALFRVAAFTGLRLGELRALRWSDIDFEKRLVHVRRSYTHGAEGDPMQRFRRSAAAPSTRRHRELPLAGKTIDLGTIAVIRATGSAPRAAFH